MVIVARATGHLAAEGAADGGSYAWRGQRRVDDGVVSFRAMRVC